MGGFGSPVRTNVYMCGCGSGPMHTARTFLAVEIPCVYTHTHTHKLVPGKGHSVDRVVKIGQNDFLSKLIMNEGFG